MILEASQRISILIPSILFLVLVMWDYLFHTKLEEDLNEIEKGHAAKIDSLVTSHYLQASFAGALIVFLANGTIIAVDSDFTSGIIFLLCGIIIAFSGLSTSFMGESRENISIAIFLIAVGFSFGELGFLSTFNLTVFTDPFYNTLLPWGMFGLGVFICVAILVLLGSIA